MGLRRMDFGNGESRVSSLLELVACSLCLSSSWLQTGVVSHGHVVVGSLPT